MLGTVKWKRSDKKINGFIHLNQLVNKILQVILTYQ
jgi:hypothetical protein